MIIINFSHVGILLNFDLIKLLCGHQYVIPLPSPPSIFFWGGGVFFARIKFCQIQMKHYFCYHIYFHILRFLNLFIWGGGVIKYGTFFHSVANVM